MDKFKISWTSFSICIKNIKNEYQHIRFQKFLEIMQKDSMAEEKEQKGFLNKFGKWAPIIGGAWIVINIVAPLALLRIPAVQKYLVALRDNLPFDIPGIG